MLHGPTRQRIRGKTSREIGTILAMLLLLLFVKAQLAPAETSRLGLLKVSENKRFLVHEDGTPFFYLGDTAWELFHRLNREEADKYLANRAAKGFTVIQTVAIAEGDGGSHLMTFHPPGANGSSTWFHEDDWLDFNMRQNGHAVEFTGRYDSTRKDYDRTPIKPVLDGEPVYEDHPVDFNAKKLGHSIAADVRRPLYWDLFSGACGHTYGHHSVWQMWQPGRNPINNPLMPWFEAIDQPGAGQMQYGRRLIESRPILSRVPDDSIVVTDRVPTSVPGAGRYRFVGTRDANGSYAMIYAPAGRAFKVRMDTIKGPKVEAWWYNPRDGQATAIGEFTNTGAREFLPPDKGEMLDWVLVLDDASQNFPPPGAR
ncbi:MAG: glycoside hydrolase family 140 protein [Planctomycetes bacterium]|nr:glycoside hydrolase family 140 protein [Planctomycetota bacterium]